MRALIQRVRNAEVNVGGEVVGAIGPGMLILLGVGRGDSMAEADWLADKCAQLRIFDDEEGQLNRSLLEMGGGALVVSQFTLYADPRKGRRPSYAAAAAGEEAHALFLRFCEKLQELDVPVERGEFGERMEISLVNDGPVTLMVETPRR